MPMRRRFSAVFPRSMFFFIADGVKYKSANFFNSDRDSPYTPSRDPFI